MASTSCASNLNNIKARSFLFSPDKVQGRLSFVSMKPRDGLKTQAALMASGPTSSSSNYGLVYEPLLPSLLPAGKNGVENWEEPEQEKRDPITDKNLDEWIKDSVGEIVRNIGEAPFLVQIFSEEGGDKGVRVEREAAAPDAWPHIQKRWSLKKSQPAPDGIILVNELREDLEEEPRDVGEYGSDSGPMARSSQMWGLVVQGRGMDCVACYILNTCRVLSPAGCCTHFCLARAQCFGDPVDVQLRNAWLQSKWR